MQTERVIHVLKHGRNIPTEYIDRAKAHRETLKDQGMAERLQLAIDQASVAKVISEPRQSGKTARKAELDAAFSDSDDKS